LRPLAAVIAGALLLTWAGVTPAAVLTVINPGFEDISGETPNGVFTFGALNGWGLYDPNNITNGADNSAPGIYFIGTLTPLLNGPSQFFPAGASEGIRMGIAFNFFGSGDGGEYGYIQTLGDTLQANTAYTLQVDVGNIAQGPGFDLRGFPGYRIELLAIDTLGSGDITVLDQDNNSLTSITEGEFDESAFTFTTGASHLQLNQALGIRLISLNQIDAAFPLSDLEVDFDNVRLNAVTVPIPPLLPLVALACATLVLPRKSQRRTVST
jgi:hypothetical protein